MLQTIRKMAAVKSDEGATAAEYALLIAGIAALIVLVIFSFGRLVQGVFDNTCTSIKTNGGTATTGVTCTK